MAALSMTPGVDGVVVVGTGLYEEQVTLGELIAATGGP